MDVQCQNCEARLSVPSVGPIKKTRCPNCGVMMLIPLAGGAVSREKHGHSEVKRQAALRRIFEPIPRPAAYAGGVLLILMLFSWLWLPSVMDLGTRQPVFLRESPTPPFTGATNATVGAASRRDLMLFNGVRLDGRREDLERQFSLVLQNMRGMQPELYAGHNVGNMDLMLAGFYDGVLKESTIVMRERPVATEVIEQELLAQYGEPQTRTDDNSSRSLSGLNGLHLDAAKDELTAKLAQFQHRRALLWTDGKVRVDALIYSSESANGTATAMLQVHLAATAWLQASQPAVRPVGIRP